ncbi:uncharacterized protein EV154DRAFT_455723 [Mucor mucedo]|uniref:uncharacterized protein n=1 Tax=Mucor mucedo TaxID=29922 RepID=UPI00221EF524|nr:uncharacterized protein EV154DRAFT_455723 [Mucor mucedo]KAI7896549.1 hypothetical protein EV154DRAFT_455723 [Mucor mucedo]
MDNNLDLEGQTAPESTRGLFDFPENSKRSDWIEKKRRPASSDMRTSKTYSKGQRGLHTVNEEDYYYQQQQQQSFGHQQQQRESITPLYQRKQRSSVTHFNNFPPLIKSEDEPRSRADVLAETEAKLSGGRYETNHTRTQDKQNRRLSEPNQYVSQHDARKRMSFQQQQQQLDDFDLKRNSSRQQQQDWRTTTSSRPHSTVGVVNNHRFSTGSTSFESTSVTTTNNNNNNQRKPLFASHLPFSSVVPHLKSNVLVSGLLRVNKRNRSDAYVFCEDINADIYICGSRDRNRALEGDHVAIKLIEVEQVMLEKREKEEAKLARNNGLRVDRKPDEEDEKEIIFGGEEDVDCVTPKHCGVVVAILDRAQKQVFSGTLGLTRPSNKRSRNGVEDGQRDSSVPRIIWFKPTDKRVPLIAIPVEQAPSGFIENCDAFENRLFLGSIKRWPITSLHPFGVLENELGPVRDTRVQLRAILADNNFTTQVYPESFLRQLPTNLLNPESIQREIQSKLRRDLRRSIQPITMLDDAGGFLENALSVTSVKEEGTFEVGLHVADITAFVGADSPLDKEARSRGIDVYQTMSESVPLWPDQLRHECTDFVPGQDRLAFSVIWTIRNTGDIVDTWYGKTVINSKAVLTRQEIQAMLDYSQGNSETDTEHDATILSDIQTLYSISQLIHENQSQHALSITRPHLDIQFGENTTPIHISAHTQLESEQILREFQILANTQVAQKICSHFPDHALLRNQAAPNERKLRGLTRYLDSLGYQIRPETSGSLQHSIDAIDNLEAKAVIATLVMKAMSQEKYFCTGVFDISRYHHYSLAVPLYTHFTCPTKRYADVLVHRQLEAALNGSSFFFMEPETVQKTAQHCNVKARAAENADEQTQHMFSSYYLADNSGLTTSRIEDAIVVGVQEDAFDVIVPHLGLERRIHTTNLPLKSHTFKPTENVLHLIWNRRRSTSIRAIQGEDACITQKECTFPNEGRQLIRPFDFVKVVITADPIRSPPLIRVLAANPFITTHHPIN